MISEYLSARQIFSSYQKFVFTILTFIQFIGILDFIVLSSPGVQLIKALYIITSQFGLVVSANPNCASISGLLAGDFADCFNSKIKAWKESGLILF